VLDWVTVSQEHDIYIADVGLTPSQCDQIVCVTEQVCRGQYAAYTYAKQTLGCREFPTLAAVCQPAIHTMTHAILEFSSQKSLQQQQQQQQQQNSNPSSNARSGSHHLALDDREPHMVKYGTFFLFFHFCKCKVLLDSCCLIFSVNDSLTHFFYCQTHNDITCMLYV
jgi:hypothetical protein